MPSVARIGSFTLPSTEGLSQFGYNRVKSRVSVLNKYVLQMLWTNVHLTIQVFVKDLAFLIGLLDIEDETSLAVCKSTRRNLPSDLNLQQHSYGDPQTSRASFTTATAAFKVWRTPSSSYRILFCE